MCTRIKQRCEVLRLYSVDQGEALKNGLNCSKLPYGELLCFQRSAFEWYNCGCYRRLGIIVELAQPASNDIEISQPAPLHSRLGKEGA